MTVCLRCIVNGRVQGVFFRASTQQHAQSLGITGYARNLADGSVEVLACGTQSAVEQLRGWLWHGPANARVDHVVCSETEYVNLSTFTTD